MENETTIDKNPTSEAPKTFASVMGQFRESYDLVSGKYHSRPDQRVFRNLYDSICWRILPEAFKLASTDEQRQEVLSLTRERQVGLRNTLNTLAKIESPTPKA